MLHKFSSNIFDKKTVSKTVLYDTFFPYQETQGAINTLLEICPPDIRDMN